VIALADRGTMFDPGPSFYMEKMAAAKDVAHLLDLDRPLGETLELIAKEKGTPVGDVVVIMLDRPRHDDAVKAIRAAGAVCEHTFVTFYYDIFPEGLKLLDDAGIAGELVLRELRTGRVEVTQMWGRPESVRQEFRRLRAQ
jgi:hypothetical protein